MPLEWPTGGTPGTGDDQILDVEAIELPTLASVPDPPSTFARVLYDGANLILRVGAASFILGGSGGVETLAATLTAGNTTGGTDLGIGSGDNLTFTNGSTLLVNSDAIAGNVTVSFPDPGSADKVVLETLAQTLSNKTFPTAHVSDFLTVGDSTDDSLTAAGSTFEAVQFAHIDDGVIDVLGVGQRRSSAIPGFGAHLTLFRSKGTLASEAIVASGDVLGQITAFGYDGVDYGKAAEITMLVDGSPASNDMPGRIVFGTQPAGSGEFVVPEVMRLNSSGQLLIGATSPTGSELLHVAGDAHITGKLTVIGAIDPTQLLLTGADKRLGATDAGALYLAPFTDAVDGVQIRKADNTTVVLGIDTENQRVGIGTGTPAATSILDVSSTTQGFLPPRMDATQRNAIDTPASGLMLHDTTVDVPHFFNGADWKKLVFTADATLGIIGALPFVIAPGEIEADVNLIWDNTEKRLGLGTTSPNALLDVTGDTPGVVGGFPSGTLHITSPSASVNANAVITGHNSFGGNKQLWYLGSTSSGNDDIGIINRQTGALSFHTANIERLKISTVGVLESPGDLDLTTGTGGVFKFTDNAIRAGLDAVEYVEMGHGGSNGFIDAVGDGGLDFRFEGDTLATFTDFGHLHLLTNVDQKHTLKIKTNDNTKDTGVAWENSGGSFTNTIYRTDVGSNRTNLVFAAGLDNNIDLLTDSFRIHGSVADVGKLEVLAAFQVSSGAPGVGKVLTSDAVGVATWTLASGGGWTDAGATIILTNINDDVGIGESGPDSKLHVTAGGSAGAVTAAANSIATFEKNTNGFLTVLTPDANEKGIVFGGPINSIDGGIIYNSAANSRGLEFRASGNVTKMTLTSEGRLGIGAVPDASAVLDIVSTTQGFLPPRMTTAEIDSIGTPATGLIAYDTETNLLRLRKAAEWCHIPCGVVTGQFSHAVSQKPGVTTPVSLLFDTDDITLEGIDHSTSVQPEEFTATIAKSYTFMLAPQWERTTSGGTRTIDFFIQISTDGGTSFTDVSNSNVKVKAGANDSNVIPLMATVALNVNDIIRFQMRISDTGDGLGTVFTAAETGPPTIPATPAQILTIFSGD